jgi:HAD superfamily hydrolase (TIGR01490 family)
MSGREQKPIAAFFDVDGTLVAKPSLERRFWQALQSGGRIPLKNYVAWLRETFRLLPRGTAWAMQANKMHLRGLGMNETGGPLSGSISLAPGVLYKTPCFFSEAIERVHWHARRGHRIVLVSGTLEPLAVRMAAGLSEELRVLGCEAPVHICATRLEAAHDRWTGRVSGEPMFGEEKGRAVRQLAKSWSLELSDCYAYGDSKQDRWLLAATGHACAVNPSRGLQRVARLYGWPVVHWSKARACSGETSPNDAGVTRVASKGKQLASEEPA